MVFTYYNMTFKKGIIFILNFDGQDNFYTSRTYSQIFYTSTTKIKFDI